MIDHTEKINRLVDKLELLLKRQEEFSTEINSLRVELEKLKTETSTITTIEEIVKPNEVVHAPVELKKETPPQVTEKYEQEFIPIPIKQQVPPPINNSQIKSDLEKFIGENLINKIGIAITVIGVGIGAKYSIENNLISPITRVLLGYLFGLGLMGIGIKLKKNYENYSAVLVSGAIAIMYFITYSAYGFYNLFPQAVAFVLMVVLTIFTVIIAIKYDKQVIAHIGLVGAYAVPFLLSEGSGKVAVLFAYMAIINIGILVLAFKKYWKPIYYSSFGMTWVIYFVWFVSKYEPNQHIALALVFLALFFIIFYVTFLAFKIRQSEKFDVDDVVLIMANSFISYGIGYGILHQHQSGVNMLGLLTLGNAAVHFMVSMIIYRKKLADRNLFYLIIGLVLIFITIAIPVQLDANWVTLLWAGEAAVLFWIGRSKAVSFYERLSYPLMMLAFYSILHDWFVLHNRDASITITPLLNIHFLSAMLFVASFASINLINIKKKFIATTEPKNELATIMSYIIPAILFLTLYYAFRWEISNYFNQSYIDSESHPTNTVAPFTIGFWNADILEFKRVWIINYSLFFVSMLTILNMKRIKYEAFKVVNIGLTVVTIIVFLTQGLYALSELRESYLEAGLKSHEQSNFFNIGIRYISFLFVGFALVVCYQSIRNHLQQKNVRMPFYLMLHTVVLWVISSELIHWMDITSAAQSYKLGLSILWGTYSLFLIVIGIWRKNKSLRIGAIVLFGVTLIKLFLYDISNLNTIAKTVVFVLLGVLLLIISFLYNKFKSSITDDPQE